jgi:hypothetical protein
LLWLYSLDSLGIFDKAMPERLPDLPTSTQT